jgi:Carboxypeptidase regulatory-like domain
MRALLALLSIATAGATCKCDARFSPCREAAAANVVFIGTVESVTPAFLDSWNESQKESLALLNREFAGVEGDRSTAAFSRLRDAYLKVFPDLPPEHRKRFERATSNEQLSELFYWILDHGKRVRFSVRTLYRNGDDDDDHDDKDDGLRTMEVWTPFGECGVAFQSGETYLVYADTDEESNITSTTQCHRTRRISEAGDDLAFLYFLKDSPKQSARIEAFVTRDPQQLTLRDHDQYSDRVSAPVAGAVVEADDGARKLRAETNEYGRAVFDGLAPGQYSVTAFSAGYPAEKHVLAGPQKVTVDTHGCAPDLLLLASPVR